MRVRARLWGLRKDFEPREVRWLRGVDAREVVDGEDYQVRTWGVRGEEGVVEPLAKVVHSLNRMRVRDRGRVRRVI